ncbi:MAG: glycosyltransferase [Candidatus Sumerlaea chitinivorans]|nr:glycosyltransferase [Candidatus Sumerlaea chitinivorans]
MTNPHADNSESRAPFKVILVINAFEDDAPTRVMLNVGEALASAGLFECAVAAWSRGGPLRSWAEEKVGRTYVLSSSEEGLGTFAPPGLRFVRLLKQVRPTLVHFSLTRPTLLGVPIASALEVPRIVITQHGTHEWGESDVYPEPLVRGGFFWVARAAHRIVTVSNAVREELLASGVPPERLVVISNGVDPELFRPLGEDKRQNLRRQLCAESTNSDVYLVGAAGNFRFIKGYDVFVRAAATLRMRCRNARFVLWGSGPEEPALRSLAETLQLTPHIHWGGRVKSLSEWLPALDVFVQPSRQESFGLATAEAMSCGVPVVVSAVGGLRELVPDGACGIQVPPDDPDSLARSLAMLHQAPSLREAMGQAARERIVQEFSIQQMQKRYLNLYEELVQGLPRYGEVACSHC